MSVNSRNTVEGAPDYHDASQPSVIAGVALALARALEHAGIDSRKVFDAAQVSLPLSNDPLHRLTASQVRALFTASVAATHDPCFGLAVARFIQPSNLHALGHALMASQTLLDFCQRLKRYLAVASQSAVGEIDSSEAEIALRFRSRTTVHGHSEDAFLAFLIHFMRALHGTRLLPLRVRLGHPSPAQDLERYTAVFGVMPIFGSAFSELAFPVQVMTQVLPGACADLAHMNDTLAADYLTKLDSGNLIAQARSRITTLLVSGDCRRTRVANDLCLSPSTLQSRLAQHGTSFQEIMETTRQELAMRYMTLRAMSITEIAFALGFTDSSNFTRAFKRWTGMSPSAHRRQLFSQLED